MPAPLQEFAQAVERAFGNVASLKPKTLERLLTKPDHHFGRKTVDQYADAVWSRLFQASLTPEEATSKRQLLNQLAQSSGTKIKDLSGNGGFTKAVLKLWESQLAPAGSAPARGAATSGGPRLFEPFTPHLAAVARECRDVVLRGIPLGTDADNIALPLASVYVQLETGTPRPEPAGGAARLHAGGNFSALEALLDDEQDRVVLVGEPGSGKSTFLQYVTLWLAAPLSGLQGAKLPTAGLEPPPRLRDRPLLPLRIILREFAHALEDRKEGCSEDVVQFLVQRLRSASHHAAADTLPKLLGSQHALLLFDGLDEVPARLLKRVRQAISSFADGEHQASRVVVTCRKLSYLRPEFRLAGFPDEHEIMPLRAQLQSEFVRGWYRALGNARPELKPECEACATSLLEAIRNDPSDRLKEMAGNPFFLTAMAGLHRPDRPLPNTGSALMNLLVDSLLRESRRAGQDRDDGPKAAEPELSALLRGLPKGFDDLRKCLRRSPSKRVPAVPGRPRPAAPCAGRTRGIPSGWMATCWKTNWPRSPLAASPRRT